MFRPARICLLLWVAVWLPGCDDQSTPRDQIRQFVARAVDAAESRSLGDLAKLLHPQYRDQEGYNQKQILALLRGYFLRHKNIHLFTRIDEIVLTANSAKVRLHVAMAASTITDIDAVAALRAQIYRFELQLIQDDAWRLQYAEWQPAKLADLQ